MYKFELEHFNFLCIGLVRHEDESGKAKNAANAIHWRVFSTPPDEVAIGIPFTSIASAFKIRAPNYSGKACALTANFHQGIENLGPSSLRTELERAFHGPPYVWNGALYKLVVNEDLYQRFINKRLDLCRL